MTRAELIRRWCEAEGGKKSALDAPQCREAYAKLRAIIGEWIGIDIEDVIEGRSICMDMSSFSTKHKHYEAFPVYAWRGGKPKK